MEKPFTFKAYDFTLSAGGSQAILAGGEYFRILSSTGALDVTVEGKGTMPDLLAGQAIKGLPFSRLVLRDKSGAPNTGFILVASSEFVDNRMFGTFDLSSATLAALESVDLNAATKTALKTANSYGTAWTDVSTMAANTPVTVFTPAANANGAVVSKLFALDQYSSNQRMTFIAKGSAPISTVDGDVLAQGIWGAAITGNLFLNINVIQEFVIPGGLGLYFISSGAGVPGMQRSANYRLL